MTNLSSEQTSSSTASEYFRLSLAKLGAANIDITPINYALAYYYVSGDDIDLNSRLDDLFTSWSDTAAKALFFEFIGPQIPQADDQLHQNLLSTIAHILGLVIEISDESVLSSDSLTHNLDILSASTNPTEILKIASEIVAETRTFVDKTKKFKESLHETSNEIQTLHQQLDKAKKQATVDALTGLQNRRGFDEALTALLNDSTASSEHALLLLDVDHFKNVNDSFGHLVGDKILIGVANQLARKMRGNDYLARFGGEEFAILLKDTPLKGAIIAAEHLRESVEKRRWRQTKSGKEIGQITISIGIATIQHNESIDNLLERCDAALYQAKSNGRNRIEIAK
jgi:diguanylate cyclase